jgi:hypothetical protein
MIVTRSCSSYAPAQAANAASSVFSAKSTCAAVITSGGVMRSTHPCTPVIDTSTPRSRMACCSCLVSCGAGSRLAAILHDLHADHQAQSSHVADVGSLRGKAAESFEKDAAHFGGAGGKLLALEHVEHRMTCRDTDLVVGTKGREVVAFLERHAHFLRGDETAERQPSADRFGKRDHIGLRVPMLVGEHPARAPPAAEHLVVDQRNVVTAANRFKPWASTREAA